MKLRHSLYFGLALTGGLLLTACQVSQPEEMVYLAGGEFQMGIEGGEEDEGPVHPVVLSPFLLDRHEVSNRQFAAFVEASGHLTQAEKDGYSWCFLRGGADFEAVQGADWQHPEGPDSSIEGRMDHPVVQVSWQDAAAYADWAGKRLPSEAEWEYASRSGGKAHLSASAHGSSGPSPQALKPVSANVWQGHWPDRNLESDGYYYTAPAGSFPANELGLYDMIGNVWEWCADWYASGYYHYSPKRDPRGPTVGQNRVSRGGSWFCSPNYCGAYSSHFRGASPPAHSFSNVGFRCAAAAE